MRRTILTAVAAIMMTTCILAQDIPAGIRMEIVESGDDTKDVYSIFKYKDENGETGYYMSVGYKLELLSMVRDCV